MWDPQKSDMNGALIMNKATVWNALRKKECACRYCPFKLKKRYWGEVIIPGIWGQKMYLCHQRQISNDFIPRMEMEKVQDEMNNLVFPVSH